MYPKKRSARVWPEGPFVARRRFGRNSSTTASRGFVRRATGVLKRSPRSASPAFARAAASAPRAPPVASAAGGVGARAGGAGGAGGGAPPAAAAAAASNRTAAGGFIVGGLAPRAAAE